MAANQKEDDDGWFDEEILDDATMDFTNVCVETEIHHGPVEVSDSAAEVESHVSDDISEEGNISEDDNMRNFLPRNVKRCRRFVTTAISALCYSRSTQSNLLQAQMGHYFLCAKTPKRPIEVAHQLGISVSYSSIAKAVEAIAISVKESVRTLAKRFPSFFVSFDNMNIFARAKGQRLHNQGGLLNLTSAWVGINPKSKIKHMLTSADVDES